MVTSPLLLGDFSLLFSRSALDLRAQFLTSQRDFNEAKKVLSWGNKKLFVRDSYVSIADRILAPTSAAPLTFSGSNFVYGLFGSPGVGKTSFIYYFFHRLMTTKPDCLIVWDEADIKLFFSPRNSQFLNQFAQFEPSQIYEVIDVNMDEKSFSHEKYQSKLTHFHLFVTSGLPNAEFYKFVIPHEHYEYMPTW
jgi:Cdc6-like AAA superfamily ATPase